MTGPRAGALFAALLLFGQPASAHHFNVFAWTDCEAIVVRATLDGERPAEQGQISLRDGTGDIETFDLQPSGDTRIPLDGLDTADGVRVEVQAGAHHDYWDLLPEDIARDCMY